MKRVTRSWTILLAALFLVGIPLVVMAQTNAPAGFDNLTNGARTQAEHDADRDIFDEAELIEDGLGPVYNAQACRECHQNPVSGAISQTFELRKGRFNGITFSDPPGGSLNNDRAIDASIQERVAGADNVVSLRSSLNLLGDGFVEAIADSTFTAIRNAQPAGLRGQIILVPVLENPGQTRVGRFGHKDQLATLLSFSADAYLNEMGITSPLAPNENTSDGASTAAFDDVDDPEEEPSPATGEPFGPDVHIFAHFMRATKVPPRDNAVAATASAQRGAQLFTAIGCNICHTPAITTAAAGTVINGGAAPLKVHAALGNKIIRPFGDFLLHDVGTGDGIVQADGASTRNKLRTPPLWGVRTHSRLMHDGGQFTRNNAILRHTNEAEPIILNYINLPLASKNDLVLFLQSL